MAEGTRVSRAEQVARDLESEILRDRLPVGAHLGRRAELIERFGISPSIANEALRILRERDLISVRPGPGGGITVANASPQVRLGVMDLWFAPDSHPLDLFEARVYLESGLTKVAFERATRRDVEAMQEALRRLRGFESAAGYLHGVLDVHREISLAAHLPVLDGMHQILVTSIRTALARAEFIVDHEEYTTASINTHEQLIDAIARSDVEEFRTALKQHDDDLIRAEDPQRSPAAHRMGLRHG